MIYGQCTLIKIWTIDHTCQHFGGLIVTVEPDLWRLCFTQVPYVGLKGDYRSIKKLTRMIYGQCT
jgi:hypothetical protein